jgi:hypothetical protein
MLSSPIILDNCQPWMVYVLDSNVAVRLIVHKVHKLRDSCRLSKGGGTNTHQRDVVTRFFTMFFLHQTTSTAPNRPASE